jgi:CSLREA domain-containing protein
MKGTTSFRFLLVSRVLLAGLALSGAATPLVFAASFTVNTQSDTQDINPGDGQCADASGKCSLRAAIEESNALPGFPPEVITLPSGTYILTLGTLEIMNSLNLNGAGSHSTIIDGDRQFQVFQISNTGTNPIVNISDVTIRNGNGGIFGFGAGIRVSEGASLRLANSVVSENQSVVGGVGILNSGFFTLLRSTVRDNLITGGGGGVTGTGAGILNTPAFGQTTTPVLEIIESTISNNQGIRGGGIANSGSLNITNSTISGNRASVGGGIRNFSSGVVNISFSTITDNQAGLVSGEPQQNRVGGGIANLGQVNIGNTILAGNRDGRTPADALFAPDCFSRDAVGFTSFRGNLVGILNANGNLSDTIFGGTPFDQVGTPEAPLEPGLEALADNGGPTKTHALRPDSPAIDRGTGATSATFFDCPETDQRGGTRPAGMACDVGAFEFGALGDITANVRVTRSGFRYNRASGLFMQQVTLQNISSTSISGPLSLVLDSLSSNATLSNRTGETVIGSPFIDLEVGTSHVLSPQASVSIVLEFTNSTNAGITYSTRALGGPSK